ncbi:MAG: type II toxin-antitoxin system RelB/DinJ family antitoxin [Lentisphaeria bacterium]|nr:type II toxin-antitoxin system RelB/DinJ family antitoxin [Lentisphaeria bacterium]
MNKTATVHARIDSKTKKASERVLQKIGMTPTDAVRLLYRQIALRREFPLELRVPNRLTAATLRKSDCGEEIETFDSLDGMIESWNE